MLDSSNVKWGPGPFRFENMWLQHPDFLRNIKKWWGEDLIPGWEGYKFMCRLKILKGKLKAWSKEVFGDVELQKKEAEARLLFLDQNEGTHGLDSALRTERENVLLKIGELTQREETKWRQRSKTKWAKEGDGNTKFFHRVATGSRKRSLIDKLEVDGMGEVEAEDCIEKEVIEYFKSLYSSDRNVGWGVEGLNWCPISRSEAVWLERPFLMEEIKRAVFCCGVDKSPGPDGYSMGFFQSCWEIVKGDLLKVLEDFFHSGIVNGITNHTFICLIPKKTNSVKISDFRPISLVSSLYKIISKILASRLREVLGSTISQAQGAFVQNRQILDAVLVANEVVEETKNLKRRGLVLKIDFEKAYDHVEWDFVDEVLERKGFGEKWRRWVKGCLESVNFSIMINGKPKGNFKVSRGLRQGDPLSPFLFTLVSDVLSRMLERAQEVDIFQGLVVGNDRVAVSHLQFADDTLILLDGKEDYWLTLLELLKVFCSVSGMKINKSKSCIFGINFNTDVLARMADRWGCEVGTWPLVYLGLPLGGNPKFTNFWNPVVEKVEKRLQNWKRACLSKGGKMTLIHAVLYSIPTYYMSLFKMPKGVADRIERIMRNFLWEGVEEGKSCHLVKWERVIIPKEFGGLGFGSLRDRNVALMAKWLWRFPLEVNSLWHKVIKSKYGLQSNGWDSKIISNVSCRNPWRDISQGYLAFLDCCRFSVGNGERIRFWEDRWLKEGVLKSLFPRLFSLSRKKNYPISAFGSFQEAHFNWEFGLRRNLLEAEIAEVGNLMEILGQVRLSNLRVDKRVWELEDHGGFTPRSFRSFNLSLRLKEVFPPYGSIWKVKSPPKVRFLVWLVAIGKVNTCDMIQRRHPNMSLSPSWCTLCKDCDESSDHLFIHCRYSLSIWWKLMRLFGVVWVIPKGCSQLLCLKMDVRGKRKRAQVLKGCLIHAIFWNIWWERNQRTFQGFLGATVDELWERVKFWAALWASVSEQFKDYHYSTILREMQAVLS